MKYKNKEKFLKFTMKFHEIMLEAFDMERHSMHFGTDTILTRPEIHLIKTVKENPEKHVTALGEILGITKGAVSQTLNKLVKKGMIRKVEDSENRAKILIQLTEKGKQAYMGHEKFHESFDTMFLSMFEEYSEEQMEFLIDFAEKSKIKLEEFNKFMLNKDKNKR